MNYFEFLKKTDKITYNESQFKSIIADITSNLSKRRHKLIKNGLKYAEEMKELTNLQVKGFKENLIKFKNYLIKKNKINNRVKKDSDNCYERNKFKGVKDIRYLFNEKEDESAHEDIRYLFSEEDDCAHESPFKSIIADIRSNLPKRGHKLIKNGLKYAEEMKESTNLQLKSFKKNLIKFKNDLTEKTKVNNKVNKNSNNCYRRNKFKGIKDIRYLFNEEEDDSIYEDIKYLFNEDESPFKSIIADIRSNLPKRGHKLIKNGLKYAEEMKDLTYYQIKSFKEKLIKFRND